MRVTSVLDVSRLKLPSAPLYVTMIAYGEMAFMTYATVVSVFRIVEAGLDPFQLLLVGVALELSFFIAEAPTGALADVYSRKWSVIVGFVLVGMGFILEGAVAVFATILLAQVVWGVGFSFISGAQQAWLADELRDDSETARVFVRASKVESAGALGGIALSVAIASVNVGLALIVGGVMFVLLAVFLAVAMPERGFSRPSDGERVGWRSAARVLRTGIGAVRASRVLTALIVIEIFAGMSTEPFDRLWAKHALDTFEFPIVELPILGELDPVVWFGIVHAAASLGGLLAIWAIERIVPVERPGTPRIILFIYNAAMICAVAVFAIAADFHLALGMVVITYVLHRVAEPFTAAWINRIARSEYRATVFSIHEQGNSLGQIAFGPVMGIYATAAGIRPALIACALLRLPPQALYLVRERRSDGDGG